MRPTGSIQSPLANEVRNVDTGLFYNSIQDAINAAQTLNGHTLEVVASLVEGQVDVTKTLTLRGATGAEVVSAGVDTGTSGDNRGWFLVEPGVDLTVQNLVFEGNGHKIYQGFRVNGTATFDGVTLNAIQYEPTGPLYRGYPIAAGGGPVNVMNSTITAFGRDGILLFGPGTSGSMVTDNTIVGMGAFAGLNYGIELGAGAVATLERNDVSGCMGAINQGSLDSAGIAITTYLGPGTAATVDSNNTHGNSIGIQIGIGAGFPPDASVVTASCNRIFGNTLGFGSTSPSVTAENNWWGCNDGPDDLGALCDTTEGTLDADPWLVLGIAAAPTTVNPGGVSAITTDLNSNSDAAVAGCNVIDGIPIAFGATGGTVMPVAGATVAGAGATTYTAGGNLGVFQASSTVDNQTVFVDLTLENPAPIPTATRAGIVILLLLVAMAGLAVIRRHS